MNIIDYNCFRGSKIYEKGQICDKVHYAHLSLVSFDSETTTEDGVRQLLSIRFLIRPNT